MGTAVKAHESMNRCGWAYLEGMTGQRSELEWSYRPLDLFEEDYLVAEADYDLRFAAGKVVATLRIPQDPVPPDLETRIESHVKGVLEMRQCQARRPYELHGPVGHHYDGTGKSVMIRAGTAVGRGHMLAPDVVISDADGRVLRSTRMDRVSSDFATLDVVAPRIKRSLTLRSMVESYAASITDPANELVHLYEVRDALTKHFRREGLARKALGITAAEWRLLGQLANDAPIEQGRHRGKHLAGRRPASQRELEEARTIAWKWIEVFAGTI
jgi:hypothetical protein